VASKLRRAIACSISLSLRKKFEKIVATPFLLSQRDGEKKTLASELFFFIVAPVFSSKDLVLYCQSFGAFFIPPSSPINLQQGGRNFRREGSGGWGWRVLVVE
jgi:hypothetical protein